LKSMFYLVGLGLSDERDVTVKGKEVVLGSQRVYLEAYTSILLNNSTKLEEYYGKEIIIADREMVESSSDEILRDADKVDVSFLVVGDPFGATTHTDLVLRAKEKTIPVKVIHNASIMNAVGCCGLQLYHFGQTISVVFFSDDWRPDSFYDKIKENRNLGLHTLCLLDIKVKEQSIENLLKGKKIYEPPRFMTVNQAIQQLLEIEEKRKENVYSKDAICVGLSRVGADDQQVVSGTMAELEQVDFGKPLHSFIIVGKMHILEAEILRTFALNPATFDAHALTH